MNLGSHNYYDHPEGQDAFGKMVATNSYALTFGLGIAAYDVLMLTKPSGYLPTIGRFAYFTGPFMGMASAFTMTTLVANKMRGTDDTWNYIAGACASAAVFGSWRRSVQAGGVAAVAFSLAAALKKNAIDEGWEFFPEVTKHGHGSYTSARKLDFTLSEERPRNWTSSKNEI